MGVDTLALCEVWFAALRREEVIGLAEAQACEPLMTVDEVAEWLAKHPNQVRNMARAGQLPAFRIGETWRFSRAAIEEWLTARRWTTEDQKC